MLTLKQTQDLVSYVVRATPDAINPTGEGGTCLYTDPKNPERHCIVGEMLAFIGATLPDEGRSPHGLDGFDEDAKDWLILLQSKADNFSADTLEANPRPWGEALSLALPAF